MRLVTVAEAAQLFGVAVNSVHRWMRTGKVKKYSRALGKFRVMVDADEIAAKMNAEEVGADVGESAVCGQSG